MILGEELSQSLRIRVHTGTTTIALMVIDHVQYMVIDHVQLSAAVSGGNSQV